MDGAGVGGAAGRVYGDCRRARRPACAFWRGVSDMAARLCACSAGRGEAGQWPAKGRLGENFRISQLYFQFSYSYL